MKEFSKEEKIAAWDFAININQIDGEFKPDKELLELIEREINNEIDADEIVKLLIEKYTNKK